MTDTDFLQAGTGLLRAFGHLVTAFGSGDAWIVTGRRDDDPGAGR